MEQAQAQKRKHVKKAQFSVNAMDGKYQRRKRENAEIDLKNSKY